MRKVFLEGNDCNLVGFVFGDKMLAVDCETIVDAITMDCSEVEGFEDVEVATLNCCWEVIPFNVYDWEEITDIGEKSVDEYLDVFVHDEDPGVRYEVARHGRDKDLDILVHDEDSDVREAVARCGRDKHLDVLVHDEHYWVREAVVWHGRDKDLDILVHDEKFWVRKVVAWHGRDKDLDVLVHDENPAVRYEADAAKSGVKEDRELEI